MHLYLGDLPVRRADQLGAVSDGALNDFLRAQDFVLELFHGAFAEIRMTEGVIADQMTFSMHPLHDGGEFLGPRSDDEEGRLDSFAMKRI
ncbi:hypothetical protein D3C76_1510550 [compost metagenome]